VCSSDLSPQWQQFCRNHLCILSHYYEIFSFRYASSLIRSAKCFMFKYLLVPQLLLAIWRSLAHTSIKADCPSGNVPITLVLRLISLFTLSITLLVLILSQCSDGKSIYVKVSSRPFSSFSAALESFISRSFSITNLAFSFAASLFS